MSHWATSSDSFPRGAERGGRGLPSAVLCAVALLAGLVAPAPVPATVFLTVDEALELAFPGCRVERKTVYLTDEQVARARELAGGGVESALVHPYVARCEGGEEGGVAYFDNHRVRTLPQTLMVVVGPDDEVARIEILAFREPPDYIPRGAWYDQFTGRELGPELALKRGIRGVTGATLTARATTEAVRRVLALHRVVRSAGVLATQRPSKESSQGGTP